MKTKELLLVGITYLLGVTIAYFITRLFQSDAADISMVIGTILAVLLAVWIY